MSTNLMSVNKFDKKNQASASPTVWRSSCWTMKEMRCLSLPVLGSSLLFLKLRTTTKKDGGNE
jgi:hypothetical protein